MAKIFLMILLLTAPTMVWSDTQELVSAAKDLSQQLAKDNNRILIRSIEIKGFVLNDRKPLDQIIKSRRNKRLSQEQIQKIIEEIKTVYLEAGYGSLVNITDTIKKNKLIIEVKTF